MKISRKEETSISKWAAQLILIKEVYNVTDIGRLIQESHSRLLKRENVQRREEVKDSKSSSGTEGNER
jgi:hypothetical protein